MPAKKKSKKKTRKKTAKKKAARKKTARKKKAAKKKAARKKPAKKKAAKKKTARKKTAKKKAAKKKATRKRKTKKKAKKKTAKKRKKTRAKRGRGGRGKAFFDHFRGRLLDERARIERRLHDLREELRGIQERPRELEEWAQEEKDRDILIRLEERETSELRRIRTALELIDAKQYGKCQTCGKPIPKARLEELPTAFRCILHTV